MNIKSSWSFFFFRKFRYLYSVVITAGREGKCIHLRKNFRGCESLLSSLAHLTVIAPLICIIIQFIIFIFKFITICFDQVDKYNSIVRIQQNDTYHSRRRLESATIVSMCILNIIISYYQRSIVYYTPVQ